MKTMIYISYTKQIAVAEEKLDTQNKVSIAQIRVVAIVEFYQNIQLPSHKKDQPGKTYFFVPPNVFVLRVVDCNSLKNCICSYMYTELEGGKGGNTVVSLIMKYLLDQGLLDRTK